MKDLYIYIFLLIFLVILLARIAKRNQRRKIRKTLESFAGYMEGRTALQLGSGGSVYMIETPQKEKKVFEFGRIDLENGSGKVELVVLEYDGMFNWQEIIPEATGRGLKLPHKQDPELLASQHPEWTMEHLAFPVESYSNKNWISVRRRIEGERKRRAGEIIFRLDGGCGGYLGPARFVFRS